MQILVTRKKEISDGYMASLLTQEMSAIEQNSSSQGKKKDRKEAVRCSLAIKSKLKLKLKTKTTKSEAMIKMQFKLKESSINEIMKNYNSRAAQILAL